MFFAAQLIGIYVTNAYLPEQKEIVINETSGETKNISEYNLPYGLDPPENIEPKTSVFSIMIALVIAVLLMFTLMRLKAETFLRLWFLIVVIIGIAIALNAFIIGVKYAAFIALAVAIPVGIIKIYTKHQTRNYLILHNATELLIYPGIATVFIPILNIWAVVILLILISIYDIYAVWHSGFMQKMAKYQIETLRIFSGFFIPYISKKDREKLRRARKSKSKKGKKVSVGVNVAILGGGDVVFPMLLAGVVLRELGLFQSLIIAIGATIALGILFYMSEKGKFYPAMPFISAGCLLALGIALLV